MLFLSSCYRVFQVSALRSYDSICFYHRWCMTCIVRVTPHPLTSIYHLTTFHPTRTHLPFLYPFPYKQKTPIGFGGQPETPTEVIYHFVSITLPDDFYFIYVNKSGERQNRTHPIKTIKNLAYEVSLFYIL